MLNAYQFGPHIIIPRSELVSRTYCGRHECGPDYHISSHEKYLINGICRVCYFGSHLEWEDWMKGDQMAQAPLADDAARMVGTGMNFDTDTYKQLFNGFLKDPTKLAISNEKALVDMSNEELTAWINQLEDFVRISKVAKQAAHVTLEDRRLQMTEAQRAEQRRIDLKYKPATVKTAPKKERKSSESKKLSQEQKLINATIDLTGKTKLEAIAWLKLRKKLPTDYPEE